MMLILTLPCYTPPLGPRGGATLLHPPLGPGGVLAAQRPTPPLGAQGGATLPIKEEGSLITIPVRKHYTNPL